MEAREGSGLAAFLPAEPGQTSYLPTFSASGGFRRTLRHATARYGAARRGASQCGAGPALHSAVQSVVSRILRSILSACRALAVFCPATGARIRVQRSSQSFRGAGQPRRGGLDPAHPRRGRRAGSDACVTAAWGIARTGMPAEVGSTGSLRKG